MRKTRVQLGIASLVCSFGLTFCNGGSGLPVLAQASVRRISISEATGGQKQPPLIELAPGMGVNISFLAVGETVQKVWFDNPSFSTLDADGCLVGLTTAQQEKTCEGAKVLHLRRINPLQFRNLPKTNSSLLTAITSANRVYLFRVVTASKPKYYTVEIVKDAMPQGGDAPRIVSSTPTRSPVVRSLLVAPAPVSRVAQRQHLVRISNYSWDNLNRGLEVALASRFVSASQPLYGRIQNLLARLRAGQSIESAARESGISLKLVRRLNELGMSTRSPVIASPSPADKPASGPVSVPSPQTRLQAAPVPVYPPASTPASSPSIPGISY
jgi:hypothetical protein